MNAKKRLLRQIVGQIYIPAEPGKKGAYPWGSTSVHLPEQIVLSVRIPVE